MVMVVPLWLLAFLAEVLTGKEKKAMANRASPFAVRRQVIDAEIYWNRWN